MDHRERPRAGDDPTHRWAHDRDDAGREDERSRESGGFGGYGDGYGTPDTGRGGQSDGRQRDIGREGHGGGSYGQGDYAQSARRSESRDDQRSPAAVHQSQGGQTGYSGHPEGTDHDHEPDYIHWKKTRLAELDREHQERRSAQAKDWDEHYLRYREHKRNRFHTEFEDWRSQQQGQNQGAQAGADERGERMTQGSSGGAAGGNIGDGDDREQERDKALSSPGGAAATDRSGVGAPTTAPDGGAGMKGAGAVGGSSATMAVKTAGPGAPNPSSGASDAGVTTGSEDKPR